MGSLNKAIVVGYLGKDPEVRYMQNGDGVANLSLATSESWKDKHGEKQEKTEWHRITLYRKLADIAGEYLHKGSQVLIEGRLETRKWTDKSGVERYTTEIIGDKMVMMGEKGGDSDSGRSQGHKPQGRSSYSERRPQAQKTGTGFDDMDDDIPFVRSDTYMNFGRPASKSYVRGKYGKGMHYIRVHRMEC